MDDDTDRVLVGRYRNGDRAAFAEIVIRYQRPIYNAAFWVLRSVEDALQLEIPLNAQYIRNIIMMAHALHDHVVHFYQLSALDWVDVTQVLKADPAKASAIAESLSDWEGNSKAQMKSVQDKVKGLVASGQLGIFAHGYWGHPAMKLAPEVNLLAVSHYLQALDYQRKVNQVVAILGDGALNYGRENIIEGYYTAHLWRGLFAGLDLQHINHPGYNRDRGPVLAPGMRFHLEF